ncbi:MAG: hypothetical protein JST54_01555 [Deltaproteobacteria bacterium]|nr:hypothetical protein [Deltaproteobacteria bacterium]
MTATNRIRSWLLASSPPIAMGALLGAALGALASIVISATGTGGGTIAGGALRGALGFGALGAIQTGALLVVDAYRFLKRDRALPAGGRALVGSAVAGLLLAALWWLAGFVQAAAFTPRSLGAIWFFPLALLSALLVRPLLWRRHRAVF